jgi:hypothetical protein
MWINGGPVMQAAGVPGSAQPCMWLTDACSYTEVPHRQICKVLWISCCLFAPTFLHHGSDPCTAGEGVQGAERVIPLDPVSPSLPPDLAQKWPYLAGCSVLRVPADAVAQVSSLVRSQLLVSVTSASGLVMDATGVQLQVGG